LIAGSAHLFIINDAALIEDLNSSLSAGSAKLILFFIYSDGNMIDLLTFHANNPMAKPGAKFIASAANDSWPMRLFDLPFFYIFCWMHIKNRSRAFFKGKLYAFDFMLD